MMSTQLNDYENMYSSVKKELIAQRLQSEQKMNAIDFDMKVQALIEQENKLAQSIAKQEIEKGKQKLKEQELAVEATLQESNKKIAEKLTLHDKLLEKKQRQQELEMEIKAANDKGTYFLATVILSNLFLTFVL